MEVHGEIEYVEEDGTKIHSDICPKNCDFREITEDYREYLHAALDEWLDNSRGTCGFYIKQKGYKF